MVGRSTDLPKTRQEPSPVRAAGDDRQGWMTTKRQQTQAKMTRERKVNERRARRVAAAERREWASSTPTPALDDVPGALVT